MSLDASQVSNQLRSSDVQILNQYKGSGLEQALKYPTTTSHPPHLSTLVCGKVLAR